MRKLTYVLLVVALLVMGGGTAVMAQTGLIEFPTAVQFSSTANFIGAITGASATFTGATDHGALTASSVDSDAGVEVTTFFDTDAVTTITVTNGAAFTPTGTYQPITAAGEVTPTITVNADAGTWVLIENAGTNTINLADSGTTKLTAAFAMNADDTLLLVSDGTNWNEVSRAAN